MKDYTRELNLWADRIEKSNYNSLQKAEANKPPQGFTPIPGSKKGGFHKRVGNKYQTWYPGHGVKSHEGKNESEPGHAQAMDNLHSALTAALSDGPSSSDTDEAKTFWEDFKNEMKFTHDNDPSKAAEAVIGLITSSTGAVSPDVSNAMKKSPWLAKVIAASKKAFYR